MGFVADRLRGFPRSNPVLDPDSLHAAELTHIVGDDDQPLGSAHPAGAHAIDTLILAVMTRAGDRWLIKALENVTLTNPRTGETVLRDRTGSGR
jgi:hypothetical protein